ncbi:oxidoreductase [Massilia norwichensis]|uniref:Oxidoreductase n=1 Tax=Massilia norwichensis TaxID=1442366 RepID=A0ABT2A3G3_9BURK|nr:oxidoreductase [Massilia norwichensis]MCS0588723.1 oxidoreductase [Massilia norwichensis]
MIEQRLRVGLIGFGYAGKTFHAPLIRATPGLELAAVASSDAGKVRAALGADAVVFSRADELIAQADIDLVVVASPNATHVELATAALEAGKHVVVDKPFTADTAQAMQLAALASQRGRLLSVFHNRRWDSTTRTASKLLASGMLGEIRYAAMHYDRFRPQPVDRWKERAEAGGGLWMDLGPHLLDEALCYFGPPLAIQADIAAVRPGAGADDSFHARLRYADGLRVDLQASMLGALPRPRLLLQGTRGTYLKQGLDPQEAALKAGLLPAPADDAAWGIDAEDGIAMLGQEDEARRIAVPTENGAYPAYYRQLAEAIRGRAANPVPPEEAIAVMRLLDAGRASSERRCEVALASDEFPYTGRQS